MSLRPTAGEGPEPAPSKRKAPSSPRERTLRTSGDRRRRSSASWAADERVRNSKAPSRRWHEVRAGAAARRRAQTRRASTNLTKTRRRATTVELRLRLRSNGRGGGSGTAPFARWRNGSARAATGPVAGFSGRRARVHGRGRDPDGLRRRGRLRSACDLDRRGFWRRRRSWLSLRLRLWLGLLSAAAAAGKERPDRVGLLRSGVGHHDWRRIADHIGRRSVGAKARQQLRIVRSFHRRGSDIIDFHLRGAHGLHVEDVGDPRGYVHHPPGMIGAAIVDAHDDRIAVLEIGHPSVARQRHRRMGGRQRGHVIDFAVGGAAAMERRAIPGGHADRRIGGVLGGIIPAARRPCKGGRPDIALRREARRSPSATTFRLARPYFLP